MTRPACAHLVFVENNLELVISRVHVQRPLLLPHFPLEDFRYVCLDYSP